MTDTEQTTESTHFIQDIVAKDVAAGVNGGRVQTRFPPEPNGFLHIGHAKAICLDFGIAEEFGGACNLRFDDTNPVKEDTSYVEAILADVRWLGFDPAERIFYASDYFERLYELAEQLIEKGHAYVCDLPLDDVRAQRGGPDRAGTESPYRSRTPAENLDLFRRMRAGEFDEGSRTLRAKIDMAHKNLLLRDPVMYRIVKASHHRTGDAWCVYPTYDWAHGQSDALEGITHSLCTLEFENHRPLYDWFLDHLDLPLSEDGGRPRQYEFARLNLTYTIVTKRKLRMLVEDGTVSGWDDPRMPTLRGLRRRGYTPEAVRAFCSTVGVTRTNSSHDMVLLENALRADLNQRAQRRMAVLRPLKVVIENFDEGQVEWLDAVNNPEDEGAGTRRIPLTREVWIERDDFLEDPPKKFFRLGPEREVRLRYGYCITCTGFEKNEAGEVIELRCTYDPETGGGRKPDGRKVKGIVHWVSAEHALDAEVRLYDHLFAHPTPLAASTDDGDFREHLNPSSLEVLEAKLEPSLADATPDDRFQFERVGYFCLDADSQPGLLVFNRSVALRDSWAKIDKAGGGQP